MSKIYNPFDGLDLKPFRDHYRTWLGMESASNSVLDAIAMEFCYGGLPLNSLYSDIFFEPSKSGDPLAANIRLVPTQSFGGDVLEIKDVSLSQFTPAGLPEKDWYDPKKQDWIQPDGLWKPVGWEKLNNAQYQLELAHTETWRWSIVFKNGHVMGGADISGDDRLSHIELINNCTTTIGFEFKVTMSGRVYHGGIEADTPFSKFYEELCSAQAGSLPDQSQYFASIYFPSKGWGPDSGYLTFDQTVPVNLDKYRSGYPLAEIPVTFSKSNIDHGVIEYDKYGKASPYFQKPKVRGLLHGVVKVKGGKLEKVLPQTYSDIQDWYELRLPNFKESGYYDHSDPVPVHGHTWLYEIDSAVIRPLASGSFRNRFELEFRRSTRKELFQLRRIVLGNLDIEAILRSPAPLTIHRFGYAARPTVMEYDPAFRPATDPDNPDTYAFLLAGPDDIGQEGGRDDSNYFTCPESFGVERAILSGDTQNRTMTVELVSFERILLLWKATFDVPNLY